MQPGHVGLALGFFVGLPRLRSLLLHCTTEQSSMYIEQVDLESRVEEAFQVTATAVH